MKQLKNGKEIKGKSKGGQMAQKLIDSKKTAELLGCSYRKIMKMIHSGEIPAIKVGDSFRIEPSEIEKYKNKNQFQPEKEEG